jgi:hypothetical protein
MVQQLYSTRLIKRSLEVLGWGLLTLPLLAYSFPHFHRPSQITEERQVFKGIVYRREFRSTPRPMMIHITTIDLIAPGIGVLVTPGKSQADNTETTARTTSEFLTEFKVQLAINANYFFPFREETPWDYYPYSGDRTGLVGKAISHGEIYSQPEEQRGVICFAANNRAQIFASGKCPSGTKHAVAGSKVLVADAQSVVSPANKSSADKPYPHMVVAIDAKGEKLWIITVDGKQPLYSEGMTNAEVTELAMQLGATAALKLDGGGSTTLVMATPMGAKVLNSPCHTKIPMRERPVANHLGFYSVSRSGEVQLLPHPLPPPRLRGGEFWR